MTPASPLKTIVDPKTQRRYTFGRTRPAETTPTPRPERLSLRALLREALPTIPAEFDFWTPAAAPELCAVNLNDGEGCCVPAGCNHVIGTLTGNAGNLYCASAERINLEYGAIGGFIPGDPTTDRGCNEDDAFDYYEKNGFGDGTRLLGAIEVDATDKVQVQHALFLCENVTLSMECPDAWFEPMPDADGFVWDVAGDPVPANGHFIIGTGVCAQGIIVDSWGERGILTWAAVAKYAARGAGGRMHALLSPDQLARGIARCPNGILWGDLIDYFNARGGNVPSHALTSAVIASTQRPQVAPAVTPPIRPATIVAAPKPPAPAPRPHTPGARNATPPPAAPTPVKSPAAPAPTPVRPPPHAAPARPVVAPRPPAVHRPVIAPRPPANRPAPAPSAPVLPPPPPSSTTKATLGEAQEWLTTLIKKHPNQAITKGEIVKMITGELAKLWATLPS